MTWKFDGRRYVSQPYKVIPSYRYWVALYCPLADVREMPWNLGSFKTAKEAMRACEKAAA